MGIPLTCYKLNEYIFYNLLYFPIKILMCVKTSIFLPHCCAMCDADIGGHSFRVSEHSVLDPIYITLTVPSVPLFL
jgi:hypothetical protein